MDRKRLFVCVIEQSFHGPRLKLRLQKRGKGNCFGTFHLDILDHLHDLEVGRFGA